MMSYHPFKELEAEGVPPGVLANQGRKKYGKKVFDQHAAEGKSLRGVKPVGAKHAAKVGRRKKKQRALTGLENTLHTKMKIKKPGPYYTPD